jgi:hypothetical protein
MGSHKGKHSSAMDSSGLFYSMADPYWDSTGRCRGGYRSSYCNMANYHTSQKRQGIRYNRGMRKLITIALSGLLMLSLTGCDSLNRYRYPCQDPKNWEIAECTPPECEASQTCTKDVIKITPTTPEQEITNG